MAEQWRVTIALGAADDGRLTLCRRDLARAMEGAGVVVVGVPSSGLVAQLGTWLAIGNRLRSSAESPVSAFASNRAAAEAAAQVAREVTGRHRLTARVSVECWRPAKRQWEDASAVSERDLAEEHDYQQQEDRRVSAETGAARWRVHVQLRTHRDTVALAQQLSGEGHQVDRRWTSVVAAAHSEDDARRLAEKAKQYAPSGAEVRTERTDTLDYTDDAGFSGGTIP